LRFNLRHLDINPLKIIFVFYPNSQWRQRIILMRPKRQKRSALKFVGRNETKTSKAKRMEVFKPNYAIAKGYWKLSLKRSGARYHEKHIPIVH
jgi:hypothetical protein